MDSNRLDEAEPIIRRALDIDERSYGPDHPNIAIRLANLSTLLVAKDRLVEAEPLMRRRFKILLRHTRKTGYQHPQAFNALESYFGLLRMLGLGEEEIMRRCSVGMEDDGAK